MLEFARDVSAPSARPSLTSVAVIFLACDLSASRSSPPQQKTQRPLQPNPANPYSVQFADVTAQSGIHFHHERAASDQKLYLETMGAGAGWIDYNQDGYLDAILINSGYTPFFHPARRPATSPLSQ